MLVLELIMLSSAHHNDDYNRSDMSARVGGSWTQPRPIGLSSSLMTAVGAGFADAALSAPHMEAIVAASTTRMGGSGCSSPAHRAQRVTNDGCRCSMCAC